MKPLTLQGLEAKPKLQDSFNRAAGELERQELADFVTYLFETAYGGAWEVSQVLNQEELAQWHQKAGKMRQEAIQAKKAAKLKQLQKRVDVNLTDVMGGK